MIISLDVSPALMAATALASVAACTAARHWDSSSSAATPPAADAAEDKWADGNAGGLAGYAQQLRTGQTAAQTESDTPFIADVWLQGGQPVSVSNCAQIQHRQPQLLRIMPRFFAEISRINA